MTNGKGEQEIIEDEISTFELSETLALGGQQKDLGTIRIGANATSHKLRKLTLGGYKKYIWWEATIRFTSPPDGPAFVFDRVELGVPDFHFVPESPYANVSSISIQTSHEKNWKDLVLNLRMLTGTEWLSHSFRFT